MALPPQDTIRPKRLILGETTIKETFKHYMIWGLVYLFIIEIISYFLWGNIDYKNFYYPLLNQLAFVILLINILTFNKRLNFCNFKKFSIVSLISYYLVGVMAMIFKLEIFIDYIQYFFLSLSFLLLMFSIKKTWNGIK